MYEIKNPYLMWNMGMSNGWPEWPGIIKDVEYNKSDITTSHGNGKPAATLTPVVPEIDRVIFNGPATIVFWNDSTKTIVKCMEGELFDEEKGIAMAFMKKMCGTGYMRKIRRHISAHTFREEKENAES